VVKFLLDDGIEFVVSILSVLLVKAIEFGNRRFGRVVSELGVLNEKPLEWCYPA
jgi:hypothetical protein